MHQTAQSEGRFSRLLVATAVVAALSIVGCSRKDSPDVLLDKAKQAEAKGDRKTAMIQLKSLLQDTPDSGAARLMLGKLYIESGEVDQAQIELDKAGALKADPLQVALLQAKGLQAKGKFEESLAALDPGKVSGADTNPDVLVARSTAYFGLRKPEDARAALQGALKLKPDHVPAMLGLARMAVVEGDMTKAQAQVDEALAKVPTDAAALNLKGDLLRMQGQGEQAAAYYQKAIAADIGKPAPYLSLTSLALEKGQFEEARKHLADLHRVAPGTPLGRYMLALVAFREKKFDEARTLVQELLKVAPKHVPTNLLAAAIEFAKGNYAQAENSLVLVTEAVPDNLYARRLLAASQLKQGQADRAITSLQQAVEKKPDSGLYSLLGEAYMQQRQYSKATDAYAKAAELSPKDAMTKTRLALSKMAGGDAERGLADLESATELEGSGYQAELMMVMTQLNRQEFDKAGKALTELEAKQPNNPLTYNLKAAVALGKKDVAAARTSLEKAIALQPTYLPAAINLARLDIQAGKFDDGRKRFENLLAKDPKNVQAMLSLADYLAARKETAAEAGNWLEKARKADPTALPPVLALTQRAMRSGDTKKAVAYAQEGAAAHADSPEALDNLGMAQLAAGDKNQALATYTKLVQLRPKFAPALFRLGTLQAMLGDTRAGISSMREALANQPDFLDAKIALVELYVRDKQSKEALTIARSTQQAEPKQPLGLVLEGDIDMADKQYGDAAKVYRQALSLADTAVISMKLHAAMKASGAKDEADSLLLKWIDKHPKELNVRLYLAEDQLRDSKYKDAAAQYEAVSKQSPNNVLVLNNLAFAYQQLKHPGALDVANQALKLAPQNPMVLDTVAMIQLDAGQTKSALDNLQKASAQQKNNLDIRYHLAQAYLKTGNKEKAKQELEAINSSGTSFSQEAEARALLKQLGQ
ncbi:XrtA/PEP-CTERM system TPR-repeat protein PrsT [Chitinivorax sp. PXF-14]|uniref:XrtA/PEP-CTERM system TPR-repeat protein PrsT n=1 Tax=Chitinivorax sp. PXF-14 TaxID=3230488 RepID=UPI0034677531